RGETLLELQSDFRTPLPSLTLEQTNFGLVAVRVAKSISGYFGTGKLTDSEERSTEAQIFGQRARWVDYSGQVSVGRGPNRQLIPQGVALMEHPSNQDFPKKWHVREDGWMGPSLCRDLPVVLEQNQTLRERSLIVAHDAQGDHNRLAILAQNFAESAPFVLEKSTLPHTSHQVVRAD
ncbi:MAG: PmoA family protein, partial [Planctomycetaceae bacterium]|nr:PmoA family protein [Planctomycetaceae bacterium]